MGVGAAGSDGQFFSRNFVRLSTAVRLFFFALLHQQTFNELIVRNGGRGVAKATIEKVTLYP